MSSLWYDPFYWNSLLSDWRVYHSRHGDDHATGTQRLPLYALLSYRLCCGRTRRCHL